VLTNALQRSILRLSLNRGASRTDIGHYRPLRFLGLYSHNHNDVGGSIAGPAAQPPASRRTANPTGPGHTESKEFRLQFCVHKVFGVDWGAVDVESIHLKAGSAKCVRCPLNPLPPAHPKLALLTQLAERSSELREGLDMMGGPDQAYRFRNQT
jgi:hypothetical protein